MIRLALTLLVLSGCAHNDPWTTRDTWMQVGLTTALAADAYTTAKIQYDPNLREVGPLASHVLGPQPSTSDTWQYFTTLAVSHYFIVRALPRRWRPYWQGAYIVNHAYWVRNNCSLELC
jgi:hypothetical protein